MKILTPSSCRESRKRKAIEEADITMDHKKSKILGIELEAEEVGADQENNEHEEAVNREAEDIQHG